MATPFPFGSGNVLTAAQMNAITTLPVSTKTASHTLTIADLGTRVVMNSASATTITVDTSIFGASDVVEIANIGAGVCTITNGTATVTTTGSLALAQNATGKLIFISASAAIYFASGGASKVLQVVSTAKTDTFTTASATFTDITGMSVTITPTSASSQILVMVTGNVGSNTGTGSSFFAILRTSTLIGIGDTASNRARVGTQAQPSADARMASFGLTFLDSPATTSATTYKLQMRVDLAGTGFFNRSFSDADISSTGRGASTITVMEISA